MDMMIDIETLALTPDAIVLSVGAVAFDKYGKIDKRFYRVLNTEDQINFLKRVEDPETRKWWETQDINAYQEAFNPVRCKVSRGMEELSEFIKAYNPVRVWANSPWFDLVILESLYRDIGQRYLIPWTYKQPRDVRTIVDLAKFSWDKYECGIVGVAHTPVYDCEVQIDVVTQCRKKLKIIS